MHFDLIEWVDANFEKLFGTPTSISNRELFIGEINKLTTFFFNRALLTHN